MLLIARRCINNNMEYNCRIHHKKHKNKSSDIFTDPVSITITIHAAHQYKDVSSSEGVSSFSEKNTLAPACPHERIPWSEEWPALASSRNIECQSDGTTGQQLVRRKIHECLSQNSWLDTPKQHYTSMKMLLTWISFYKSNWVIPGWT